MNATRNIFSVRVMSEVLRMPVCFSVVTSSKVPSPKSDTLKFVDDPNFAYEDFAKRGSVTDIPTFRAQDYSWEDHGFSLANRLYSDIGNILDEKFNVAYNLTYYTYVFHLFLK